MEEEKIIEKLENIKSINADKKIRNEILNCIDDIEYNDIKVRIKSTESAIRKMKNKNTNADGIKDLLGMMVVTNEKDDIYEVTKKIVLKNPIAKVQNYISHPKNGYKSIHINFEKNIGNEKVPVEIQVKTKEMYEAQRIVHDKIYKNYKIPNNFRAFLSKITFKTIEDIENIKKKIYENNYKLNEDLK